jgi:hypothetical protein
MKTLYLQLEKKWFDQIESGEKTEEYRELKPYWINRLIGRKYDRILFVNGYNKDSRRMVVECEGISIVGCLFVIKLGKKLCNTH